LTPWIWLSYISVGPAFTETNRILLVLFGIQNRNPSTGGLPRTGGERKERTSTSHELLANSFIAREPSGCEEALRNGLLRFAQVTFASKLSHILHSWKAHIELRPNFDRTFWSFHRTGAHFSVDASHAPCLLLGRPLQPARGSVARRTLRESSRGRYSMKQVCCFCLRTNSPLLYPELATLYFDFWKLHLDLGGEAFLHEHQTVV
jgi:hypothetical protein